MAGSNSTLLRYPRSNITPELWVPYVLIGASCVTFLAVHFWCYHKRNRIRYLRKRDESRVKSGLLERRRITTLIMSRYQTELDITPDAHSCHPAEHRPWETELQGRSSLAYNEAFSLEDNVEVVMDGALAAAAREDQKALAVDNAVRISSGLSTLETTSRNYGPMNVFTLENTGMFNRFKDIANQVDQPHRYEIEKFEEGTSDQASFTSIRDRNIGLDKPEVTEIFNISQRYAWNKNSSLLEDSHGIIPKHTPCAQGYSSEKGSQPHLNHDHNKDGTGNICGAKHSQTDNEPNRINDGEATCNPTPQIQNVQPCGDTNDQIDAAKDITHSSMQTKKDDFFRTPSLKTDTPPSSISSPVSTSTVFVFHGHSPYSHQETRAARQSQSHLATDLKDNLVDTGLVEGNGISEDLGAVRTACNTTELSSVVSLDLDMNTSTPDIKHEAGYTKGIQTTQKHSSGAGSKTYVYAPCAQTDNEDSASDGSPREIFKNVKAGILQSRLPRLIPVDSSKTRNIDDKIFTPAMKDVKPVSECSSDPPSYDEIAMCLPQPVSSVSKRQSSVSGKPSEERSETKDTAERETFVTPFNESGEQRMTNDMAPKLIFQHKRKKRGKD